MNKAKLIKGKLIKSTEFSAGYDIYATEDVLIPSKGSRVVPTGVILDIAEGYEGQVRGRSGLNFKHDIICPTGTIDSDYKNEIKVKLYNKGTSVYRISKGERIAQIIISQHFEIEGAEVIKAERVNGFGSTNK